MSVMALAPSATVAAPVQADFDFGAWMVSEQRRVFLLCYRMLRDRDEADMAAQDAFFKAHRALAKGESIEIEDHGKWITRIAVNTCLDRLRSQRWKFWQRRPSAEEEDMALMRARSSAPDAEAGVFATEISDRLQQALAKLSERQRAVFTLKHFEERKLEEIAEILGLDVGTVKAHMARAVARLREDLRDLYLESGK
jgi:RNA polymerase sigma-70 factor (ECF subfamily)